MRHLEAIAVRRHVSPARICQDADVLLRREVCREHRRRLTATTTRPTGTAAGVIDLNWELRARTAAFDFLRKLQHAHPDVLPAGLLQRGFEFEGRQISLLGSGPGIWKPAALGAALSVMTTAPKADEEPPYQDQWLDDTRVSYADKGTDPDDWMNRSLRSAWQHQLPIVYLHGVRKGAYLAEFPVFVARDRPSDLRVDLVMAADPLRGTGGIAVEVDGRRYLAVAARTRLHQHVFRLRVLEAYRERCTICALRPSRSSLRHGLQEMHRVRLRAVPRGRQRPDEARLEWRYERFRAGR